MAAAAEADLGAGQCYIPAELMQPTPELGLQYTAYDNRDDDAEDADAEIAKHSASSVESPVSSGSKSLSSPSPEPHDSDSMHPNDRPPHTLPESPGDFFEASPNGSFRRVVKKGIGTGAAIGTQIRTEIGDWDLEVDRD